MAEQRLDGLIVAALVTKGFEEVEFTEPRDALVQAGAVVKILSPKSGEVQAFNHADKGQMFRVDVPLDQANAGDFDAVLLPGGTYNADKLRIEAKAQEFIRKIEEADKPIAVICHAPWLLVSAGLVNGRSLTSYRSLKDDILNAGGRWLDLEVVRDRNWVSSRGPDDIPAFNREMIALFAGERVPERAGG
jgi:protease I